MSYTKEQLIWGLLRIALGWIFLWAFLDKIFGLGFSTSPAKSWLKGVSPTSGFLKFATKGPLTHLYQALAGHPAVDWLFMLGLLLVGLSLVLGIAVRLAGISGIILLALIFSAKSLPPVNNPILDEHIFYILVLFGIIFTRAGRWIGLEDRWDNSALVKRLPFLK